ncbi:hypothetical protein AB4059_15620 [Lysobacter sp. 2RAF19]
MRFAVVFATAGLLTACAAPGSMAEREKRSYAFGGCMIEVPDSYNAALLSDKEVRFVTTSGSVASSFHVKAGDFRDYVDQFAPNGDFFLRGNQLIVTSRRIDRKPTQIEITRLISANQIISIIGKDASMYRDQGARCIGGAPAESSTVGRA